jgi:hypothetical protein
MRGERGIELLAKGHPAEQLSLDHRRRDPDRARRLARPGPGGPEQCSLLPRECRVVWKRPPWQVFRMDAASGGRRRASCVPGASAIGR